jgi:hypothetical protein
MPSAHSEYSASGFEAARLCPGKPVMEAGRKDTPSKYADEGTAAHTLLSWCLDADRTAHSYLGVIIEVDGQDGNPGSQWPVTEGMAKAVQTAMDNIHAIVSDGMLLSEQRVNYSSYLGVAKGQAWGTSDVIALRGDEGQVHDYKHGMGVEVDADENDQMMLYALGALVVLRAMGEEPTTMRLVIHQPRIKDAPSEWVITVPDLEAWGHGTARSATITRINAAGVHQMAPADWQALYLRPNVKSCKFCRAAKANACPALQAACLEPIQGSAPASVDEFEAVGIPGKEHIQPTSDAWLDALYPKLELIEMWGKNVLAEIERRALAGAQFKNCKVVMGKKGNRAWSDPAAAEAALKAMRLKLEEMYDLKLISPTRAGELAPQLGKDGKPKPVKEGQPEPLIGPRQWPKLQALITQADGRPSVVPIDDKRQAITITPVADDFEPVADVEDSSEMA